MRNDDEGDATTTTNWCTRPQTFGMGPDGVAWARFRIHTVYNRRVYMRPVFGVVHILMPFTAPEVWGSWASYVVWQTDVWERVFSPPPLAPPRWSTVRI